MVIYIDILTVTNVIVNYLLLYATVKITGRKVSRWRTIAAALLGGVYSWTILLPESAEIISVVGKIVVCILMTVVTVGMKGKKITELLKDSGVFLGISFLFAGFCFGIWSAVRPGKMLFRNGAVYFDIDAATLVLSALAAYVFSQILFKIFRKRTVEQQEYKLRIRYREKVGEFLGFVDSGNFLTGTADKIPVVVAPLKTVESILPVEIVNVVKDPYGSVQSLEFLREYYGVRYIPYSTASGAGTVFAVEPDEVIIIDGEKEYDAGEILLGISGEKRMPDKLILSPQMIKIQIKVKGGEVKC